MGVYGTAPNVISEPSHDKTNKMTVRPAKTQISLGIRPVWSESSLFAWRKLGSLATHWAQAKILIRMGGCPLIDYCFTARQHKRGYIAPRANAQADLSVRWAHSHFVGFVIRWLICYVLDEDVVKVFVSTLFIWAQTVAKLLFTCCLSSPSSNEGLLFSSIILTNKCQCSIIDCRPKKTLLPPLGNFADIVYLKEQSFLHRIRDVCTL